MIGDIQIAVFKATLKLYCRLFGHVWGQHIDEIDGFRFVYCRNCDAHLAVDVASCEPKEGEPA